MTIGASLRFSIIQADISYYISSGDTKFLTNVMKFTVRVGG
ncbi:MAG: hypothetical protein ABSG15_06585 [FCB group bacterium]